LKALLGSQQGFFIFAAAHSTSGMPAGSAGVNYFSILWKCVSMYAILTVYGTIEPGASLPSATP